MNRLPLPDQLPYHFYPPRVSPFWVGLSGPFFRYLTRRSYRVCEFDFHGLDRLRSVVRRGDGVMIAPNHPDFADPGVVFEMSRRVGLPFCYMAAYQIFSGGAGLRKFLLPRLGVFPVDREGADRAAFAAGLKILTEAGNPLVIFPEGEIYHMADRLTPIREGAAALAVAAARKKVGEGKTVWVVPTAIKYRFLDSYDPLPDLHDLMGQLEARFTWRNAGSRPLLERMYRYAEGLLTLKELEYFDAPKAGPLRDRIDALRSHILDGMEARHGVRGADEPVPVRVKNLRASCLKGLCAPEADPPTKAGLRRDLNDLFLATQLFSYPGDYVRDGPTVERLAEILTKFEQDALEVPEPTPRGPRRVLVRVGEPIDVAAFAGPNLRGRDLVGSLTTELESRIQSLLDEIGPGRPLPPASVGRETTPEAGRTPA